MHDLLGSDERFLAAITDSTSAEIRKYLNEPSGRPEFIRYLHQCQTVLRAVAEPGNDLFAKKVLIQYALVRALAPDVVVETGVANGSSSTHLLLACHLNGRGHLYSIDVGNGPFVPPGKTTGWMVPDDLRSRWTLILGEAREILPQLLARLGRVDMFIHDSDHSYAHMKFEFEQSYPYIRPGGLLLSDDANFNTAFDKCIKTVRPDMARVIRNIGILQKR